MKTQKNREKELIYAVLLCLSDMATEGTVKATILSSKQTKQGVLTSNISISEVLRELYMKSWIFLFPLEMFRCSFQHLAPALQFK